MKPKLNTEKLARALGAESRGPVRAGGGYFGALELAAEVGKRFRVHESGGRPTDPTWTERRQLPLRPETLAKLVKLATLIKDRDGRELQPMQLAAMLLEKATNEVNEEGAVGLVEQARKVAQRR